MDVLSATNSKVGIELSVPLVNTFPVADSDSEWTDELSTRDFDCLDSWL